MITRLYTNGRREYVIENAKEYEETKKRVDKGGKLLEGKWFDKDAKIQKWVEEYQMLAEAMLVWELDHDLIKI